jgi:ABC-type branched-subunit amino acid transport system ATPase component
MNAVSYLIDMFYQEEKYYIITLIILSLVLTVFQINGISYITAQIIESAQSGNVKQLYTHYKWFIAVSLIFGIIYCVYKKMQFKLMVRISQWAKQELFKLILKINDVNVGNANFIEFITPITRISTSFYILLSNFITSIVPICAFLIAITGYLLYKNTILGSLFFIGNALIFGYLYLFWDSMLVHKDKHETIINTNEFYIMDILNNVDKVFYRGQCNSEIDIFQKKTDDAIIIANTYIDNIVNHTMVMNTIMYITIFAISGYLIRLKVNKGIDTINFITFFTILLLYRDRMFANTNELSEYVEFIGRIHYINAKFSKMVGSNKNIDSILTQQYKPVILNFDRIRFKDVSFQYDGSDKVIFSHFNIDLNIKNKMIGITGLSGRGKSSFIKLILRLHEPTEGTIFIDDVDIATIDPQYIRKNITYINQNAKLFNTKIVENIMYGCLDKETCDQRLKEILEYSKIKELFKNLDITNDYAGNLGENLSGGQRQIVNIISGLVNPSEILVLDEPTNALDIDLKKQILTILTKFKKYKKAILIITHDRDMYPLFDEKIRL